MNRFKELTFIAGAALAAGFMQSCSETADIDLDKDIKKDIQLAPDGLSVPLGDFSRITLDSLFNLSDDDQDNVLRKRKDGTYALSVSGAIDPTSVDVDDIVLTVTDPVIDPVRVAFDGIVAALPDMTPIPGTEIDAPVSFTTDIQIDEVVDDALILVKDVDLQSPAPITVAFSFPSLPSFVSQVEMKNFAVSFPDFIRVRYAGNDPRVTLSSNTLTIEGQIEKAEIASDNGFEIPGLYIDGLSFSTPKRTELGSDGKRHFILTAQAVGYDGTIKVSTSDCLAQDMKGQEIDMYSVLSFSDMTLGTFTGKLFPRIDPINSSFEMDLGDDAADILQSDGNSMILSNPEIAIDITTGFSIPFVVDMNISSFDKAGNPICSNVAPDGDGTFVIPASPRGQTKTTTVLVYRNGTRKLDMASDTVYVLVSRMSDLLSTIPDKVEFELSVIADTTMTNPADFHYVNLADDLKLDGAYSVNVPLEFDDLRMSYTKTMDGLSEIFEDIDSDLALQLKAKIVNTIPLDLMISAVPLDVQGNRIDGVSMTRCDVKAGTEASPSTSDLLIGIDLKSKDASKFDALELNFGFASDPALGKAVLKASQYVELTNVALCLPDGLTIVIEDEDE